MHRASVFLRLLSLSCALALLPTFFLISFSRSHRRTSNVDVLDIESAKLGPNGLRPRHHFTSYDEYLQLQLNKTLNPKLRKVWSTTDWRRKINVFSPLFRRLQDQGLLHRHHKVLCIGARLGQEVVAFKEVGVADAVGIDLVPAPPLVIHGDIHRHPFPDSTFDVEFSNVLDHALLPHQFVSEVERTLKPHGVAILHVALHRKPDKYSVTDLRSVEEQLLPLFQRSDLVHVRPVDAFGLDTEVVMRKRGSCARVSQSVIARAEPLITTEPTKPWVTFKKNMRGVRYLPTLTSIANRTRYRYLDLGARTWNSSIGSWFQRRYPHQNHPFTIYAMEPDPAFKASFANHPEVVFLPLAAWTRNETVAFGMSNMGRIHEQGLQKVQGVDLAEWVTSVSEKGDFLVVKMDVEGAEFEILEKMVATGAICLVDELFLECHYNRWQRCCPARTTKYTRSYQDCVALLQSLRRSGVLVHQWW